MLTEIKIKTSINIGLIMVTLIMGIMLHKTGKPYHTGIFTVHKLATVAFIILMIKLCINQVNFWGLSPFYQFTTIVSALSILGLLISGAFMSLNKLPGLMLTIHRFATALFLLSIMGVFSVLKHVKLG